jgi:hypothetical protein
MLLSPVPGTCGKANAMEVHFKEAVVYLQKKIGCIGVSVVTFTAV